MYIYTYKADGARRGEAGEEASRSSSSCFRVGLYRFFYRTGVVECFTTSFRVGLFSCLTLSSGERRKRERVVQKKGILTYLLVRGFFVFFFCGLHSCLLSFSFSPPPPPPSLVFFREEKTLLSSRLEFFSSAYLAILLFSSLSSSVIMGILEKIV